jgi:hypothetical protein
MKYWKLIALVSAIILVGGYIFLNKNVSFNSNTNSGIKGNVLLGPTCPVVKDPPEEGCEDKPFETTLVVTTRDGARVIKEFSSDENGKFSVSVASGEYSIKSAAAANVLPYCASNGTVIVSSDYYIETTVYCDSGIR